VHQFKYNLVLNSAESLYLSGQSITISTNCQPSIQTAKESGWWVTGENNCLGGAVLLEIRDVGTGISKEKLQRVFDPYYTTKDEGRGLGLPLVLEVVRSHQGRLLVSSHQGKGTVFKVFFPVGQGEKLPRSTVYNGWN
jgi:signal transduction histidine kinase